MSGACPTVTKQIIYIWKTPAYPGFARRLPPWLPCPWHPPLKKKGSSGHALARKIGRGPQPEFPSWGCNDPVSAATGAVRNLVRSSSRQQRLGHERSFPCLEPPSRVWSSRSAMPYRWRAPGPKLRVLQKARQRESPLATTGARPLLPPEGHGSTGQAQGLGPIGKPGGLCPRARPQGMGQRARPNGEDPRGKGHRA